MIQQAHIKIHKSNNKLTGVALELPIWDRINDDSSLLVDIPFLGLQVFAENADDVEHSAVAALKAFFINSEAFGKGIIKELEFLGWKLKSESKTAIDMTFDTSKSKYAFVFDQMTATGDKIIENIALEYV